MSKVIAFGDTHFPWADLKSLEKIYKLIEIEKPDFIIHLGDLNDQYVFSKYDTDLNKIVPEEEVKRAKIMSVEMWKRILKAHPKADCVQLLGNHDFRRSLRIMEKLPELADEIDYLNNKYYEFDNVETLYDHRSYVEIDGVYYIHGWSAGQTSHMHRFNAPVVRGHSHHITLAGVCNHKTQHRYIYESAVGCLIDYDRGPFEYVNSNITNWHPAVIIVRDGLPDLRRLDV